MKRPRRRGRGMPGIVRLCRMCHGDLGGQCWNCRPSRRAPYHPGPGYTLEGRRASEYPVGTILVDVYFADRWEVMPCPKRRGVITRQRRLSDGFEVDDYQDQARYLTPEEISDPETWPTPSELDREHWRWRGMRPQKGGWDQPLWVVLQETWRKAVTAWFEEVGYE